MTHLPQFAVVGHPNKGKSSIVSTLARDDSVLISHRSGTTDSANVYKIETGKSGYTLIDTPGFQRPTKVLNWLKQQTGNASERAGAVHKFVNDSDCKQAFPDEVALLTPIMQGAAILYVVDGSRPYGVEYEAEMEILRWTGKPSMALINPIENSDYIEQWESALSQYFKSVRVFNPMTADMQKQTELLQTFSHLNPDWRSKLNAVVDDLIGLAESQKHQACAILARLVEDLCTYQTSQKVLSKSQAKHIEPVLQKQYTIAMKQREEQAITELLALYSHLHTRFSIEQFDLPPDLFDCDQWYAWGLNKKQLISASAMAGAASGAALDFMVAGHSFMLGAIGGGLAGAGTALLSANKLLTSKVKGMPLGGYQASIGPIQNRNFPYVIIGRFIYLFYQVSQLNHADRRALDVSQPAFQSQIEQLQKNALKDLHNACDKLSKQKVVDNLEELLRPLFDNSLNH